MWNLYCWDNFVYEWLCWYWYGQWIGLTSWSLTEWWDIVSYSPVLRWIVIQILTSLNREWHSMYWVRRGMIISFRLHPSLMRLIRRSTLLLLEVQATEVALLEDQVVGSQEVSSIHLLEVGQLWMFLSTKLLVRT